MLTAEPIPAEGARYTATLVFLPGLWAGPELWRPMAGYLAHRGWEGMLVDLRGIPGGLAARSDAVAELAATLPAPPILLGHDAGALVAWRATTRGAAVAAVLLAPLVSRSAPLRRLVRAPRTLVALLLRRPVGPPGEGVLAGASAPAAARRGLGPEPAAVLWEAMRRGPVGVTRRPVLVVGGDADPLLPLPALHAFARRLGADARVLEGAGHWPHVGPGWQGVVPVVHRWLVQRLGEPLLERYAEAMAEREAAGDDDE
jgi:pimeloyl-ACP methyl ester carboxylesterase